MSAGLQIGASRVFAPEEVADTTELLLNGNLGWSF